MKPEIESRLAEIEEVQPDETDLAMLEAAGHENPDEYTDGRAFIKVLEEYKGKVSLRIPKTLHRQLAVNARFEGVSLNQYIVYLLSRSAGA